MVRLSTGRMLERRRFAVVLAADGHEALAVLRRGMAVDLLLTDIVMPEIYGIDLVRLARGSGHDRPGRETRLIPSHRGAIPRVYLDGHRGISYDMS